MILVILLQILFLPSELSSIGHFTVMGELLILEPGAPGLAARLRATPLGLEQKLTSQAGDLAEDDSSPGPAVLPRGLRSNDHIRLLLLIGL